MLRFVSWAVLAVLTASSVFAQTRSVFTSGLAGPQKIVRTAGGKFLVSESGPGLNQGRISVVSSTGMRSTLVDGLPAGLDNQGDVSGPTGLAAEGSTIYLAIGEGDSVRSNAEGVQMPNPAGASGPIFSSILKIAFSADVDNLLSPFVMESDDFLTLSDGYSVELGNADGETATVSVLVDFPNFVPDPNAPYRPSNPWGLAMSPRFPGVLFLNDASLDALVRIDAETGRSQRFLRFPKLANPLPFGPPVSDFVPTSLRAYSSGFLLSRLSGFPFASGVAAVSFVDVEGRTFEPFISGLTAAVDVLVQERPGERTRFYTLEFSDNFLQSGPGKLMRYDSPQGELVVSDLAAPTSMALDPDTGDVYITELATGNIVKVEP